MIKDYETMRRRSEEQQLQMGQLVAEQAAEPNEQIKLNRAQRRALAKEQKQNAK